MGTPRPCASGAPPAQVCLSDLPPDVSLPTAEAVLFIGKAVRVLKQPMSSAASHQALRAHAEILGFSQALHSLQAAEGFGAAQFDHCIEMMRAKVGWITGRASPSNAPTCPLPFSTSSKCMCWCVRHV